MDNQVEVLLPNAAPHGFDYRVPEEMTLKAGDIVSVPFGRSESLGVVWGEGKATIASARIKTVAAHHAQFPPLSAAMRQFIDWAAWYNCAPKGAMLKMTLPIANIDKEGRSKKNPHPTPLPDREREAKATPEQDAGTFNLALLSDVQKKAAAALEDKIGKGFSVTLLDGVTGSGKTEVYFDAIACAMRGTWNVERETCENTSYHVPRTTYHDSQILVLLPEIVLSVQWLERFKARFGFTPVVWNSGITPAKKRAAWQAIAKGEARVVVGARSALFLPYKHLSLLIADEEHDASYKQEDGVVYHARDMAVARARFEKLPLALVSATPSLESYYNARQGKYAELSLPARHGGAEMPAIEMIDMRKTTLERGAFVSSPLRQALADAIGHGHQAMLFLNRRGYAPLVLCRACGHRFQCPHCSSWMVLHKKDVKMRRCEDMEKNQASLILTSSHSHIPGSYLQCHHCDYRQPLPRACPACAAEDKLAACGPGVERLSEEVASFLPQVRVVVMTSDSMRGYRELADTVAAMSEKRIDLLIGTQMIAKGHHFADLAVVGVVDADLGLAGGDLRAAERTYQLLHQLSGRAGREQVRGTVYLQSFLPEHPVMKALVMGDREAFLQAELQARERAHMPPFSRLAAIIVDGASEELVMRTAKQLAVAIHPPSTIRIFGPAPAPLYRLSGKFRYRLLVRAERTVNLPDTMRQWVNSCAAPSSVRVKIDIDPMSFL